MIVFADFLKDLAESLITLLIVIDPIGAIPFFQSLTAAATPVQRRTVARRTVLTAFVVLLTFAYLGDAILGALHVTLNHIMMAGGIFILVFAIRDAASGAMEREISSVQNGNSAPGLPDLLADRIAVFPLGIPLLAGPGAVSAILVLNHSSYEAAKGLTDFSTALAILISCIVAWLLFSLSSQMTRLLKPFVLIAVGKVMDILMGAIGISLLVRGAIAVFGLGAISS
jgi:multiple antibiotic resistance protein